MRTALYLGSILFVSVLARADTIRYNVTFTESGFSAVWDDPNGFIPNDQVVFVGPGGWNSCLTPSGFSCAGLSFHPANSPRGVLTEDYVQIDFEGPNGPPLLGFVDGEFAPGALQRVGTYQNLPNTPEPATLVVSDISVPEPNGLDLFGLITSLLVATAMMRRRSTNCA